MTHDLWCVVLCIYNLSCVSCAVWNVLRWFTNHSLLQCVPAFEKCAQSRVVSYPYLCHTKYSHLNWCRNLISNTWIVKQNYPDIWNMIFFCFINLNKMLPQNSHKRYNKLMNSKLTCQPKTSPNLKFCFTKIAHRPTFIKHLWMCQSVEMCNMLKLHISSPWHFKFSKIRVF